MNTPLSRTFAGVLSTLTIAALMVAGALMSIVATAPPASGLIQLEVTSNGDSDVGSLRDMIAFANTADDDVQIFIPASVGDITLTSGELVYTGGVGADQSLTLIGSGNTITQTMPDARVINDTAMTLFTMSGLTITGGDAGDTGAGGGIFVSGSATIVDSTITGNEAGDAAGGIRVSNGPLILINSTVSGNTAVSAGGAYVNGDATIVNSTITGNSAVGGGNGGGLYIGLMNDLRLVYSTVVGNSAANLGANVYLQGEGEMETFGSVVASPLVSGNCAFGVNGTSISAGYNWDDDGSCDFDQPTDHSDAGDPELGALAENGGPTQTMLPAETSGLVGDIPAVACGDGDALAGFAVTTDQRGEPRPDVVTGACDIGAVELQFAPPPPPPPPTPTPATPVFLEPTFTG